MASYNSTTFGVISGRHGNVVAYKRNGKTWIRKYTRPKDPRTGKQIEQRKKFGFMLGVLQHMRDITVFGYGDKGGYFKSASSAIKNAVVGTYPDLSIDYSKVQLSSGCLHGCDKVNISMSSGTNVSINWNTSPCFHTSPDDLVHFVFLDESTRNVVFLKDQSRRSAGKIDMQLPVTFTGAVINCWIFFTSSNGKQRSDSQYIDTISFQKNEVISKERSLSGVVDCRDARPCVSTAVRINSEVEIRSQKSQIDSRLINNNHSAPDFDKVPKTLLPFETTPYDSIDPIWVKNHRLRMIPQSHKTFRMYCNNAINMHGNFVKVPQLKL